MARHNRDDFPEKTKSQIAKRAGWLCSYPSCRRLTIGSTSDGDNEINIGTAAHICAAAPGGPRYDSSQTRAQRISAENGIWMCRNHGTAVDAKDSKFTVEQLLEWKAEAQKYSWSRVMGNDSLHGPVVRTSTEDELISRLHAAAAADLEVFRRSEKWPSTAIALTLHVDGSSDSVSTSVLATALSAFDDLILVAPPGMGKTTTLFQIADAMLAKGNASPIIVPLGDWSTDSSTLLESILKRPAFQGISEDDLRAIAAKPGVILLLDGWNELDGVVRKRLSVQVDRLQAELPEIGLLISTRKQALDVPFGGKRINLLPLSEMQQLSIARSLRGDAGVRIIDHAWRTTGVRELVTIPLYLTTLLALPEGAPFPVTKEEILRGFVAIHEEDPRRAEALVEVTYGLHQRFLEALAVIATRTSNTTIAEHVARKCISDTDSALADEGQITEKPQPNAVLDAFVSYHVLIRIGDPAGYSFQHQQFQEWYASHLVERQILASLGDAGCCNKLKAEILNQPAWEEAILFACERLARGDQKKQEACGAAILAAFEVDPMLASEMIFRSTDQIWARVSPDIQQFVKQWHSPGKIDRAFRFMINSGRPEFIDKVWPLITHENDQIHLPALRAGRIFRPSLLGSNAVKRIAALSSEIRKNVLHEIAFNSGMDGLDLAAAIAMDDPDPEVKATIVDSLAFRRADRHVTEVLRSADEKTLDLVARSGLVENVEDEDVQKGLNLAHERQLGQGVSAYEKMSRIVYGKADEDLSGELARIISEMEIKKKDDAIIHLIYKGRDRYLRGIADGLLQRVRFGLTLFYGADDFLSSAGFVLEDEELLEIALSNSGYYDDRAAAAASVMGPRCVGRMIEAVFEAKKHLREANGKYGQSTSDRYHILLARIAHTPGTSLVTAICVRSKQAGNEEMADLSELISRHPDDENDRGHPFDSNTRAMIAALVEEWGNRMLASTGSTRWQLASIAELVRRAPSVNLLPLLKRLLDEELRRYRGFREEAKAMGWHQGRVRDEASTLHIHQYQRAFEAINVPETGMLVREYLHDEDFGQPAARILASRWITANEPIDAKRLWGGVDFSHVEEKRAIRASDPAATSEEAEAIFGVLQPLISDEATEAQKKHAVALSIVAVRLPHGQRDLTIHKLISLAPRRSRAELIQNLILSGESIDIEIIREGIREVFEEAKVKHWILDKDSYDLREWLRLLPFTNNPGEAFIILRDFPDNQRRVDRLEEMISCFGMAPGSDAEKVLFRLAEADPKLYANHAWRNAVIRRGTLSAAQRFVDLAADGVFEGKEMDSCHIARQIGGLINEHPKLRAHVYQLLKECETMPGLALLARAVAEAPDGDGLLLLIKIEIAHKLSLCSYHLIQKVVTEDRPSESWKGAFEIAPVPAEELRRKLIAMTAEGGLTDVAARCLNQIDEIRDEYGTLDSEPRHPDLASGKPWPILKSDLRLCARD